MSKIRKMKKQKIKKADINYDTPISAVEDLYKIKTGFPPDTKLGDIVKEVSPVAARVLFL